MAAGQLEDIAAKAPATCGAAIDVPLRTAKLGVGLIDELIDSPGAKRSTIVETLEKAETASVWLVELTVIAVETQPGNALRFRCELLPEMITVATFSASSSSMTVLNGIARATASQLPATWKPESQMLMLIARRPRFTSSPPGEMRVLTSFSAASMSESKAVSALSELRREKTCTAKMVAALATH